MSQALDSNLSPVEVKSWFVRERNVLLARAKFSPMYVDYYLHLMQHGIRYEESADLMLKEALAAMTLHLCSRPQDETCAWTINLQEPLMNLFVTGGSRPGRVTGRIFTEDVKKAESDIFISQTTRPDHQTRQSVVAFQGTDLFAAAELFYQQSEQRPTRLFRLPDEEFWMFTAQPDCDLAWLEGLTDEQMPDLEKVEQLSLLETRFYGFECGCSVDRLYPLLTRLPADDLAEIFSDGYAKITCPRCAAVFNTPKSHFEDWQRSSGS